MNMKVETSTSPVDNLIAGDFMRLTNGVTLLKNDRKYLRGDILEINAEGKAVLVTTASKAKYILAEDVDATVADAPGLVFSTGEFHADECNFNSVAEADVIEALHVRSIFLK